ncbi:extracellular solute-binding protein [Paenibacillus psychroresistens]|uniref:Probable sugar-binding periplasmic protein n=1 Tax=Paenibacillus psychroresistens TaxID=1778678 RepID=A0A6B8REX8_9BACL|nr:extracellular solute-binding protein [Paenibacillus psychroresistens]QGQ93988.1 extracellular solute-binding protein [Paenibacillus psychroresistens]
MKKSIHLSIILGLLLFIATGCGSNTKTDTPASSSTAPAGTTAVSTPEPTKAPATPATPATPKKVELNVFMSYPQFKDQLDKYFEQFKAKELAEKNIDVTIKLEMPNADQSKQILQTRLASNDAPDLFTLHANDIPTYYKAGYLSDLSAQPSIQSLYEPVKKTVTFDGKVVSLPIENTEWGYLYNKKIFSEQGLTPPQTLDEMKTVIDKLNGVKIAPFELAFQEAWVPQLMTALSLGAVVSSKHPDWIAKMNTGEASYKDVADIFNIIDLVMANGTKKPFEVGNEIGAADFANGKSAMWLQGPWNADAILKVNPQMEFGVAALPVSNDAKDTMINLSTSTTLALSPLSKNQDVALDLLNYILDPKDSSALFQELKFNPNSTVHTYKASPWVDEASAYVAKGRAYQDLSLPNGVTDEQAKLLQSYYAKTVTKEQFIKAMDKKWADAVKAAK